ncbi:hypothetical protein Pla110_39540 [Polystyrenella longa]|uniref:AhpC/TSA family protein n=1 Tax=Polystyrenella longa TaxID=2528007 RepID=A0A518CSI4_9PLAN|nr:hypothetical protein [Polystyrenella longa]QDU82199.1 hypothetical protein Pla110_39540 [Polystyrenella longa]
MRNLISPFLMLSLLLIGSLSVFEVHAEEKVVDKSEFISGIPVDEPIDTFNVLAVTGKSKGRTLCYACQFGGKPVIAVFFKSLDEPVLELLEGVNETAHSFENKKLRAFGIYLTDDPEAAQAELEQVAADRNWDNLPLTVYDGEAGPANYEIKEGAEVNVLMWVKARVKANHAYQLASDLTAEERAIILQNTEKILP